MMDNVEGGELKCHPEFDIFFHRGPSFLKISIASYQPVISIASHQNKCPR